MPRPARRSGCTRTPSPAASRERGSRWPTRCKDDPTAENRLVPGHGTRDDMHAEPPDELTDDELADLARLADGTLPAERRAEVEARVAASQRYASVMEQQGMAIDALRSAAATGAPARLRADVERRRGAHRAL